MAKKKGTTDQNPNNVEDINSFINKLFNEMIAENNLPVTSGAVYKFDISVGQNGITITPNTTNANNSAQQVQSLKVEEREPLVDIIERKDGTTVIAELPGVDREKIELHADHERLSIKVESGKGMFSKLITFPSKVDPVSATARYNSGVLEIAFKRSNTYKSVVKIDVM